MNWYGDEIQRQIAAEMKRRLHAASIVVLNKARELISVPGTTSAITKFTYRYGGRKLTARKGSNVYGSVVSEPGEPPRKQYGHLRRSVAREVLDLVARVGTNLKYGRWLELGTRKMAARPWLRRALNECREEIRRIVSKPMGPMGTGR